MKKTAKKTTKNPLISKRKLAAYGLGIGGCGAMLAGSAEAVLVDVSFEFESLPLTGTGDVRTLTTTDGFSGDFSSVQNATGTASAGVGRTVWRGAVSSGGFDDLITLRGTYGYNGFYQAGSVAEGPLRGKAVYAPNTVDITFGDTVFGTSNSAVLGAAEFAGYNGNVLGDVTGVIGFKTFGNFGTAPDGHKNGNWGYIEFSWEDASSTLTVLSAKVETVLNTPITFEAVAVPEANPATLMALLSLGAVGLRTARRRKAAAAEA